MDGIAGDHEKFMRLALAQAEAAGREGEVPIGALLVREGHVIAAAHNQTIALCDPTAHAEILVLRQAAERLGNYRLGGATLYVTLEPCIMCAGALVHARIATLVFGAEDAKGGGVASLYRILDDGRLNHAVAVRGGVLKSECAAILSGFFRGKRIVSPTALNESDDSGEIPKWS